MNENMLSRHEICNFMYYQKPYISVRTDPCQDFRSNAHQPMKCGQRPPVPGTDGQDGRKRVRNREALSTKEVATSSMNTMQTANILSMRLQN
jgi:hypothetical protein